MSCFFSTSAYQPIVETRRSERARWRSRHYGRGGTRRPNFPLALAEIPPFGEWLRERVSEELENGTAVDPVVEALSKYPSRLAKKFRSLYAYGYRYRVQSAELSLKTRDSGIAATFLRECRFGLRDPNPIVASVEYVGHLDEIIELNYGIVKQVVLIGTWVKANYRGASATVKKDEWGFTIANFSRTIPFGRDSFAFPSQVQQVFYADCLEDPAWKIVIRTDPRGKRVVASDDDAAEGELFATGRDNEFTGLRTPATLSEAPETLGREGRTIRLNDMVDDNATDLNETFDADLGQSSEEE